VLSEVPQHFVIITKSIRSLDAWIRVLNLQPRSISLQSIGILLTFREDGEVGEAAVQLDHVVQVRHLLFLLLFLFLREVAAHVISGLALAYITN
jgi:hypothetical protein